MSYTFDPVVERWFRERFGSPTEPQALGWPEIAAGRDTLISAPTGSGKTLAAFLICIDRLVRAARAGTLKDETQVVYVSPLKALSNDVHRNLEAPLAEIAALAEREGVSLMTIRTAVRTGDTPMLERTQMLKKPPHILVTTPESLFILLTAEKPRAMLRSTATLIVDEIHALADDKRGSHLALSLARLDVLTGKRPQRIGLSATVKPIEEVACLLGPDTRIVDVGHRREMELAVEIPRDELSVVASTEMWNEIYDRVAELILAHRTTLVFVNTRRLSERVAHALGERLGADAVLPHHGSLSRQLRLDAEARLKRGELQAVVATASLELGIDIGTVELVCQIGSPRSIAVALQRIGRSGHWVGAKPKGRLFATTRDELIECAALISAIRKGELERIEIPENALDILAQQIVAACAAEAWNEDDLYGRFRAAYPYRNLPREDFDAVIEMLSEGIATSRGRSGALLHRDRVNGRVKGRRGARLAAITSGGAIPENANYAVIVEPDAKTVGTLDEDFAMESLVGDVFLLGTHSWRIKRVEPGRVRVEDAHGAAPSIPFWLGEAPGRSRELSAEVTRVRERIVADDDPIPEFLIAECALDEAGAKQAAAYVRAGTAELGVLPSQKTIVAERFFDEAGGMQLILHAPFGSRITRAWGLALRKRFCRTFNFELQAAATDNGLVLSLSDQHSFPLELVFAFLKPGGVEDVLRQALLAAPMFGARWRWNTTRALAVLRFGGGKRVPAPIQRMRADDLLAAVFPDQVACGENLTGPIRIPDHPLVKETIENCLYEAMDVNGLRRILEDIDQGRIRTVAIDTSQASQFSHEILNANPYAYLDDAPLEERRTRAVQLRQRLGTDVTGGEGVLDPATVEEISAEAWPEARDADELHDAMLTLVRMPPVEGWQEFFAELLAAGRASAIARQDLSFWVATERLTLADDSAAVVGGWMESSGPVTVPELSAKVALPSDAVEAALLRLEAQGQVLRGHFRRPEGETEWCNRRILARIHRATLGRLRREIEPVTASDFDRFLQAWQHVAHGAQLHGADGALQIIRQLQGYEIPAAAWESEILARRIAKYEPGFLDELCFSGEVMWARVSPHPALAENRRVRPTRIAPVTLFLREDADWLMSGSGEKDSSSLSHAAREVLAALERNGASFFVDLTRHTHRLASEVEDGLWELLAGGFVTADGFDNLRALIDPKRRRGEGRGEHKRPRHAAGRWAVLPSVQSVTSAEQRLERFAQQLLMRWGVLLRDLLVRETLAPPWRDLLPVLRRMEARGEIRGGRFVSGFTGEQFARPEALELLRLIRRTADARPSAAVSNADPLNLSGIILPGPRVSRLMAMIGSNSLAAEIQAKPA
ncbi:MAG TPA: DEAD/DEAH box helicase [Bryobacteraceae bacterium]|jgi:ATP-dependent Lhr-like helicase|nr:DEAD/DEAH box helicase [Bryobacteraceae bacterium]